MVTAAMATVAAAHLWDRNKCPHHCRPVLCSSVSCQTFAEALEALLFWNLSGDKY